MSEGRDTGRGAGRDTGRYVGAENEARPVELLSVSRADAAKYEVYRKWYGNDDGLFTALGKFTKAQPGTISDRISLAGGVKVRSTVESLRNPVHRVVEFYATTMLSGLVADMLKVDAKDGLEESGKSKADALKTAIERLYRWSSLDSEKQVAKRYIAMYGLVFVKVVKPDSRDHCYLQFIKPEFVTDYDMDERGNITYIRLDTPDVRELPNRRTRKVWRSEVWRKGKGGEAGYMLAGETERINDLSVPTEERVEHESNAGKVSFGKAGSTGKAVEGGASAGYPFDFVPFVVAGAQKTGEKWPEPVYAHGLHLISWICREATRLSDLMFRYNKAFKVIFGMGNDANGRPLPPPKPGHVRDLGEVHANQQAQSGGYPGAHTVPFAGERATVLSREDEDISIEGIAVTGLPGTAQMADATPNINYEAARQWIKDHLKELYEELPELLYYATEARANQSGAALRTLIAGALSRAEEMQDNLIDGLAKATEMALTIAQLSGIDGFDSAKIGTYENEDFEFSLEPPEILPLTKGETEAAKTQELTNAQSLLALLGQLGVSEDEQQRVILEKLGHEDLAERAGAMVNQQTAEGAPDTRAIQQAQQQLARNLGGSGG